MSGGLYSQFLGKRIGLLQKDGFTKYGVLEKEDDEFIQITFRNGSPCIIRKDFIVKVEVDR